MKNDKHLKKLANDVADAIVELVERTDGPVTLAQVEREVPGFAKKEPPTWSQMLDYNGRIIWDGMTEAGSRALREVMYGRKVAVQFVNAQPYILENCVVKDEDWWPIVLLPAKAANLESPTLLIRASQEYRDYCVERAAAEGKTGHRPLRPGRVRGTADRFSV